MVSGCTTTKTIIEYKKVNVVPPDVLLTECVKPFDKRPKTYGEAVERDEIWSNQFSQCANKINAIREFFNKKIK